MAKKVNEYRPKKSSRGTIVAVAALTFCTLAIALPSILVAQLIVRQDFVPNASFVGSLKTSQDPVIVSLPADLAIAEVLVARGQDIKQGETVATFDTTALTSERYLLENATAALVLERRCLLDPSLFNELEMLSAGVDTDLEQRLSIALEACGAFFTEAESAVLQLQGRADQLAERLRLLEQQRTMLGQLALDATLSERQHILLAALKVDLQLLGTREQRRTVENQLQRHAREGHLTKISRLRTLTERIDQNTQLLERVDAALEAPRVVSPVAGKIQRVRAIQRGSVLHESTELLQIAPSDQTSYRVSFSVDTDTLNRIHIGQVLDIRALGDSHETHLPLAGRIATLNAIAGVSGSQNALVLVELDSESVARLSQPNVRLALHGTGTASVVTLKFQTTPIRPTLSDILKRNCMGRIENFCPRTASRHLTNGGRIQ